MLPQDKGGGPKSVFEGFELLDNVTFLVGLVQKSASVTHLGPGSAVLLRCRLQQLLEGAAAQR